MKALYFATCFPAWAAPAVSRQVQESLSPYVRYLNAARAAANSRRRAGCRWEAVEPEQTITLRPLDALVVPSSDDIVYRINGCPAPDDAIPIFWGDERIWPRRTLAVADGALIWLDKPLPSPAAVYWMGHPYRAERVPAPPPTVVEARRDDDSAAPIRSRYERDGRLHLVVEGAAPTRLLSDRGETVPHETLDPARNATTLRGDGDKVDWTGERRLSSERLPKGSILVADNGVRWRTEAEPRERRRRQGSLIQLLAPEEVEGDELIDPRVAFCEDGVSAVRIDGSKDQIRVYGSRRSNYQLELESLPPPGSRLTVAENTANLTHQLQAVLRLKDAPLPHHRGLLRLCESLKFSEPAWPRVEPQKVESWSFLSREELDGTSEQREFVEKALGTPDFAFLEGPPGSGKTHAICELILQSVKRGERVLLCSTTHVAVDNVLERFVGHHPEVEAVRIGRTERVDPRVQACQIDQRIASLMAAWKAASVFAGVDPKQLERMAESIVLGASNLTCATTTGVLGHPYIRRSSSRSGPAGAYFDLLILDEASKTTFQEFLVPAQLARAWTIVGDVRQLPPFTEPRDLEASFAEAATEKGIRFPSAHQRACLILFRLLSRREARSGSVRWLVEEPAPVVAALMEELEARGARGDALPDIVRVTAQPRTAWDVGVADIHAGAVLALRLYGAETIVGTPEDLDRVRSALPPQALPLTGPGTGSPAGVYRTQRFLRRAGVLRRPVRDGRRELKTLHDVAEMQRAFFREESWARQISWRMGRIHQLASARNQRDRQNRRRDIESLMPATAPYAWVGAVVDMICDVGVRSAIEALRVQRLGRSKVESALSAAIPEPIWNERAVLLTRQHRMHPDISSMPRRLFYQDEALKDANTIARRDAELGWSFLADKITSRRIWVNVRGHESNGRNLDEIGVMRDLLQVWIGYAERAPRPNGEPWEIACLSFYTKQEIAIRDMLRALASQNRGETRFQLPNSTVVCGTVDRFQGREADLVLISLRNTSRTGYMDSPNRLNVAITRARQLLVIVGNHTYFSQCPSDELAAVAAGTVVLSPGFWR